MFRFFAAAAAAVIVATPVLARVVPFPAGFHVQMVQTNGTHSGHWIMEENPQATIKLVTEFLGK